MAVNFVVWQGTTGAVAVQATPVAAGSPADQATGVVQHRSDRRQLEVASLVALATMAGASLVIGWLVAGRFLRPLRTITATTKEISATNLHERLNLAGPDDELKELADTFDQLLDRLERSFAFEHQFVANASHELRTPLAGMRTSLDVAMAKREAVPPHVRTLTDRLRRELDHADQLLESFLTLAQAQQGPLTDRSTVSLAELSHVAVDRRSEAISAMRLDVEQRENTDVWVTGSQTLLSRMVENLVENAVKHNQPGGWLRVTTTVTGNRALLVVDNGGPVLDPVEIMQITQPFWRAGAARTGSDKGVGMGLAIVSSIVEVHGGTLDLEAFSEGGLSVAIALPLVVRSAGGVPA